MTTRDEARARVAELVEKFQRERNRQQSEADVRAGYIDRLFLALGWNVYNDPGKHTNYRREGYIRGAGFVDVGLELGGQPVLFLEAKRFNIIPESAKRTGDRTPEEKQAFRYTRGKKIQYAILTNFERLHLFNADHERLIGAFDSPEEYLDRFEELWRLTPEEVSGGSLGWWERDLEKKDVDMEFLRSLRAWRLTLANAIFVHNASSPELQEDGAFDFDKLMAAVQRILDRLILIRYGDDKEVLLAHDLLENTLDDYRKRGAYASKEYLMRAFVDISHEMDKHHNTTLFAPDHLCEKIVLPNEVLASVLEDLNRISFRKFTSDILGNTYESYLGTKLKLVNGKIEEEERTDTRKAQGIYYTPAWVVDYIVDKTLGERLRELETEHGLHAIEKVRGLSVLDPACGSGSFLIKAYHVLADFYQRMNQGITQEQAKLAEGFASADMFERLARISHLPQLVPDFPQMILQEHLYGLDLDPEAAEIATVNLTMQAFADSRQKKLPHILNENIKVGNSLISGTEEELEPYFGEAWQGKRPFNWTQEFPGVMERGGFDVVFGNPPWGGDIDAELDYFHAHYPESTQEHTDSFKLFINRGLQLARNTGVLAMIVPNALLAQRRLRDVRLLLLKNCVKVLADLGEDVFPNAVAPSCILVVEKSVPMMNDEVQVLDLSKLLSSDKANSLRNSSATTNATKQHVFEKNSDAAFIHVITGVAVSVTPLGDFPALACKDAGINYQRTNVGMREKGKSDLATRLLYEGKQQNPEDRMYWKGEDIGRYSIAENTERWCRTNYRPFLRENEVVHLNHVVYSTTPKILLRQTADHIIATMDYRGTWFGRSVIAIISAAESGYRMEYFLGLLNSNLFIRYYRGLVHEEGRVFAQVKLSKIKQLPIRVFDLGKPEEKQQHDGIVGLVEEMLGLQKTLAPLRGVPSEELAELERRVAQVDRAIDEAVYALYGLTDAERRLVEGEG